MTLRQDKISELLSRSAAEFFRREATNTSLITVTRSNVSPDMRQATVFITVLPESEEENVLNFCMRKKRALRDYVRAHTQFKILPWLDVQIDPGEKNRHLIDSLSDKS